MQETFPKKLSVEQFEEDVMSCWI